jgi:hypothetical protein
MPSGLTLKIARSNMRKWKCPLLGLETHLILPLIEGFLCLGRKSVLGVTLEMGLRYTPPVKFKDSLRVSGAIVWSSVLVG